MNGSIFLMLVSLYLPPLNIEHDQRLEVRIYVDDGFRSQLIQSEIKRDWLSYGDEPVIVSLWRSQYRIKSRWDIKFINKYSLEFIDTFEYPCYTIGRSREIYYFRDRAFISTGSITKYVEYLVLDYDWPNYSQSIEGARRAIRDLIFTDPFSYRHIPDFTVHYKPQPPWINPMHKINRVKKRFKFMSGIRMYEYIDDYYNYKMDLLNSLELR